MIQARPEDFQRRYREELDSLRQDGAAFARAFPTMAGKLGMDGFGCSDPHVERLIESFAWLAARLGLDLDQRLPQLAQSILDRLYPQLTAPLPSMAIAQFHGDPAQAAKTADLRVPRGTELLASHDGHTLRFTTSFELELWPITIAAVDLLPPSAVPAMDGRSDLAAVLRIGLACQGRVNFEALRPRRLRLHLSGPRATAMALYDLLVGQLATIAIADDAGAVRRLPATALHTTGFAGEQALLPSPPTALDAFRLLQERAGLPEKFLFLDLDLAGQPLGRGQRLDLCLGLRQQPNSRLALTTDSIRLNAVPIVNLFRRLSEPLRIDHTRNAYRLEPDSRASRACEIHTIEEVWAGRQDAGSAARIPPLFAGDADRCHWFARRVNTPGEQARGSDMLISFADRGLTAQLPAERVLFARLLCTNRGLAEGLAGGARLAIERALPLNGVELLARPTRQRPARLGADAVWRLMSQLSLNHLSLADETGEPAALRELLGLWGERDSLRAIGRIRSQPAVRRLPGQRHVALVHGLDVTLSVDRAALAQSEASVMLLGGVLSHFFGRYAAANSFVALTLEDAANGERIGAWPARAGALALI